MPELTRISDLIARLQSIMDEDGDMPIFSSDGEPICNVTVYIEQVEEDNQAIIRTEKAMREAGELGLLREVRG